MEVRLVTDAGVEERPIDELEALLNRDDRPAAADCVPIFAPARGHVVSSVGNNITTLAVPTRPPSPCHRFQSACSVVRGVSRLETDLFPRSLVGGAVPPSRPPGWIAAQPPAWVDGAGRRVTLLLEVIAGG